MSEQNFRQYLDLAREKNFEYLSETYPTNKHHKEGTLWRCKNMRSIFDQDLNETTEFECNYQWVGCLHGLQSRKTHGCPDCNGRGVKTLLSYQQIAKRKGVEYILDYFPTTTHERIENAWSCSRCINLQDIYTSPYIFTNSYNGIQQSKTGACHRCIGNIPLVLLDYKNLALRRGFTYINNIIPQNNSISIEGWMCQFNHIWSASYTNINCGETGCSVCSKYARVTIEDYHEVARKHNGFFNKTEIPATSHISTNGWVCEYNHATWNASYNSIDQGNWCPTCAHRIPITLHDYKELAKSKGGFYDSEEIPCNVNTSSPTVWRCSEGHVWQANYNNIRRYNFCPRCSDGWCSEEICRQIFEELLPGYKFLSVRPSFMEKLELDGYNEELNLAFEYNGEQHYKYIPFFHNNNPENFEKQKQRDIRKQELCDENEITLITIKYDYNYKDPHAMKLHIAEKLRDEDYIA